MRFITDYCRINQKLARMPYPLFRIVNTVQQLEVFHYVTALYINMGYYTIRLSSVSQDIMEIVTEFVISIYNCLPMIMVTSENIFQAKVDKLPDGIEYVKTYINFILVLSK